MSSSLPGTVLVESDPRICTLFWGKRQRLQILVAEQVFGFPLCASFPVPREPR